MKRISVGYFAFVSILILFVCNWRRAWIMLFSFHMDFTVSTNQIWKELISVRLQVEEIKKYKLLNQLSRIPIMLDTHLICFTTSHCFTKILKCLIVHFKYCIETWKTANRALTMAAIVVIKLQWHLVGDFRTFPWAIWKGCKALKRRFRWKYNSLRI